MGKLLNAVIFMFFICIAAVNSSALPENLVPNGDFEIESAENPGRPADWSYGRRWTEGGHYWVDEDVPSGERAMKIESLSYNRPEGRTGTGGISVRSERFPAPPGGSTLDVSAWIKAEDVVKGSVGWHYLRLTIHFWDKEGKRIRHIDLFATEGTLDWTKIESRPNVPEGTDTIDLVFGLSGCTGTGWIDGVRVSLRREAMREEDIFREMAKVEWPVIIPEPWKFNAGDEDLEMGSVLVRVAAGDARLRRAIESFLESENVPHDVASDGVSDGGYGSVLISGGSSDRALSRRLRETFPGVSWRDLGEQGYFLSVGRRGGGAVIYLGANTEQGRFYGLQSLKQLVERKQGALLLHSADIADRPALSRRGVVLGSQWFGDREEAVRRLAGLKCNYIWSQGSFMGGKFGGNWGPGWREPFTAEQLETLKKYLELARENFLEPALSFSPRFGDPHPEGRAVFRGERYRAIRYSSDEDIDIIVDKMSQLYEIGFRHFGLNFDDLQNRGLERLTEPEDIEKFGGDIGRAHYYFTLEVYNRLRRRHRDLSFGLLPLWYGGFTRMNEERRDYLRTVGRLPREIEFVSCPMDVANIEEARRLTDRHHLIWDNFFAGMERGGAPVFVPPIDRSTKVTGDNCPGYIFLPMVPANEDAAGISWMTAADYMWSPERYDLEQSFRRAVAKAVGSNAAPVVAGYTDYMISNISREELSHGEELVTLESREAGLPDDTREQRLAVLREGIDELNGWREKLAAVVPDRIFAEIEKEIDGSRRNLKLLLEESEERPFPVKVKRAGRGKEWDRAVELTDFYVMAGGGKKAEQQTRAYLSYDDKNLYMRVIMDEPEPDKLRAEHAERDSNVFLDDSLELFFDTNLDRRTYFHIAVNSLGTVYDAFHGGFQDTSWQGDYSIDTDVGEGSWTVDITIPFSVLGVESVNPGDRWNFNVCRARFGAGSESSSYALLVRPGFHAPDRFWTFEFEEPGVR